MFTVYQRFSEFGDAFPETALTEEAAEKLATAQVEDILESFYSPMNGTGDWRQNGDDMVYTPAPDYIPCRVGDAAYWDMWDEILESMEEIRPETVGDGGEWRISRLELAEIIRRFAVVVEEDDD